MRQAFRRYAFPMIIIAAVLAAALPLNSFAVDNLPFEILPAGYGYLYAYHGSESRSFRANTTRLYGFSGPYASSSSLTADFSVFDLGSASFYDLTTTLDLELRLYRSGISSLDFNIFFGVAYSGYKTDPYFELKNAYFETSSGESYDIADKIVEGGQYFKTSSSSSSEMDFYSFRSYNLHFSSTTAYDITEIHLIFGWDYSTTYVYDNSKFYVGVANNASLTSINGQTESLLNSLGIVSSILNSMHSSNLQNDALIIDYLDDILSAIQAGGGIGSVGDGGSGSDPGTGEGEDILQEGAVKQEQLEQLGDALSNVSKPSIENITQSFDPADTLISADPGMIQNALSIVYSWDKFLILLGLFIAVGTISYIIFGKKS